MCVVAAQTQLDRDKTIKLYYDVGIFKKIGVNSMNACCSLE